MGQPQTLILPISVARIIVMIYEVPAPRVVY
jgi:hypothetical protein